MQITVDLLHPNVPCVRERRSYRKTTGTPSYYKNVPVTKLRNLKTTNMCVLLVLHKVHTLPSPRRYPDFWATSSGGLQLLRASATFSRPPPSTGPCCSVVPIWGRDIRTTPLRMHTRCDGHSRVGSPAVVLYSIVYGSHVLSLYI